MSADQRTDEEIMALVAQGDLDVLQILFDKHHKHVYNFLFKMSGDKMLSEDLTQDVFYKVIKYRTSYNNGSFISWLFTIARNSIKTHFTRNKEVHNTIETVLYKVEEKENHEDYSHLHKALQQLEPSDRELVVLNRLQGIKYQELADIMNSTPGAVKTKMSRALKKLKSIYLQTI